MIEVPVFVSNWIIFDPGPGISMLAVSVLVGSSSSNELTVKATNLIIDPPGAPAPEPTPVPPPMSTPPPTQPPTGYVMIPTYTLLQARQQYPQTNSDFGWNDEFALQVIESDLADGGNSLIFRVKRLDSTVGWGQQLQVDIMVVGNIFAIP